jgi:hypothetical protein
MDLDDLVATVAHLAQSVDEQEGAEGVHRTAVLLSQLPIEAQKHLTLVFEWAIAGIRGQIEINRTPELQALHKAYTNARDLLVVMLQNERRRLKSPTSSRAVCTDYTPVVVFPDRLRVAARRQGEGACSDCRGRRGSAPSARALLATEHAATSQLSHAVHAASAKLHLLGP